MLLALTALAGGFGAATRFWLDGAIARHNPLPIPLGTVVINVSGALLLGLLTGLALDVPVLGPWKHVLGTGFLGGYTTFSTASVEGIRLASARGPRATILAVADAGGMLAMALVAAALGLWLGRMLAQAGAGG